MVSIQDLQAKANQELDRITAEPMLSMRSKFVDSQNEKLATLKQQVNDLIAAGSVDPAYATL